MARSRTAMLRWLRRPAAVRSALMLCAGAVAVALLVASPGGTSAARRLPAPVKARTHHHARAATTQPAPTQPSNMLHVLFVGASITSGLEQTSLDSTYPGQVVAGLRNQGIDVDWQERARWGALVADALTWPYPPDQQIIAVHLITNDFLRGTPIDTYQDSLRQVLVDLHGSSPQAHLVCLGVWGAPGSVNPGGVSIDDYDAAAQQTCRREHGDFVPLDGIFATAGSRGPKGELTPWGTNDGWHPNDVGAERIADAVLATIPPSSPSRTRD